MSLRRVSLVVALVLAVFSQGFAGIEKPRPTTPLSAAASAVATETYIPIVPPVEISQFLSETQTVTNFLANLPIDNVLAHEVLEKILDAIVVQLGDIVSTLLKAFGFDLNVDLGQFSFKFILNLLHFYSYNEDAAVKLLESWSAGSMTPEQEEALRRLYLSQMAVQIGFQSAMQMADDASEGLYDLIDLILGATRMVDQIGSNLGAGELIARIKNMINQRIVFGFQNAVELATSPISEPTRSRIRAVASAIATTYVKWKDLQIPTGFGGIAAELVTKVGVGVMGKATSLMAPKIGIVSITQPAASLGVSKAAAGEVTGTWDQARLKLLDDNDENTETGFTESVVKNTLRKTKLSRLERQIANVAGAVSQITQLINIMDPSGITKVVSICAAVLAGGLQVHSVFNSVWYMYKVPGQLKVAINTAFHPDQTPPGGKEFLGPEPVYSLADGQVREHHASKIREAYTRLVGGIEEVADVAHNPEPELLMQSLERLDTASFDLVHRMSRLGVFQRKIATENGAVLDPVYLEILKHQMAMASVLGTALPLVMGQRDAKTIRALRDQLSELESSTRQAVTGCQSILEFGMMEATPSLELEFPGSVRSADMMTVKCTLVNNGSATATNVELRLALPDGFRCTSNVGINVGTLTPGKEKTVTWQLVRQANNVKKRSALAVFASSTEGNWASRIAHISR